MTIEDTINTLDLDMRLVPYLKLKGHISYKAMRLTGQYLAKTAKALTEHAASNGLDTFNGAMGYLRSQPDEDMLMEEMGLEANSGMWETICSLVRYGNKLNFDCQELLDPRTPGFPGGRNRTELGATWKPGFGVSITDAQRRENWLSGLKFHQVDKDTEMADLYKAYVKDFTPSELVDKDGVITKTSPLNQTDWEYSKYEEQNPNLGDFLLTPQQWGAAQIEVNIYDDFGMTIIDVLMDIGGSDEADFDDLPIRAQITAIENMRTKLPDLVESALKRISKARITREEKTAQSSAAKGLILGLDKYYCEMLSSSRYANFTEFMYNFSPAGKVDAQIETRDMVQRSEAALERSNARRKLTGLEIKAIDDLEKKDKAERDTVLNMANSDF